NGVVVQEDVVDGRGGVGEAGGPGGGGGGKRRLVRLGAEAGGVRHADGGVLRRGGADVVGHRVVDDPRVGGVVERDGPAEIGCPVVDDHVVADVDRLGERVGHHAAAPLLTREPPL